MSRNSCLDEATTAFTAIQSSVISSIAFFSRTRKLSSLPEIHAWDSYMDQSSLAGVEKVDAGSFLLTGEFGDELDRGATSEVRDFKKRVREFLDHLVDIILSLYLVSSNVMQGLYSFCPEILFEGDDHHVFQLFRKLLSVLKKSGCVKEDKSVASCEEFTSYVVDARKRHVLSGKSAEGIPDVVAHLLADYSFLSRRNPLRVLKLCCLFAVRRRETYPSVSFELDDCSVDPSVLSSCITCVQSYVLSPCYKQKSFFTQSTMEAVRDAISGSRAFLSDAVFDPWDGLLCGVRDAFVEHYDDAFSSFLSEKKKTSYQRLYKANRPGSLTTSGELSESSSCVSGGKSSTGSRTGSVRSVHAVGTSRARPAVGSKDDESLADLLRRKGKNRKSQGSRAQNASKSGESKSKKI